MSEPRSRPLPERLTGDAPAGLPAIDPAVVLLQAAALQRLAATFAYPEPGHRDAQLYALSASHVLDDLRSAWADTTEDEARAEYSRLFIGVSSCPLNETAWTGSRRPGGAAVDLADLQAFYQAFGAGLPDRPRGREAPDQLSTELEFLAWLCLKHAWAAFNGWDAERVVTEEAIRRFLEAHLGRWARTCAGAVRAMHAHAPYREATFALERLVDWAVVTFHASVDSIEATEREAPEPDAVGCPYAGDCGAPQPPAAS